MRQKRAKAYKKQVNVYLHTFRFRDPFQILVDDEMVLTCDKASYDMVRGFRKTINGDVKPMITQCCIQSLYKTDNQRAIDLAKRFERRRCNHSITEPWTPSECIKSVVNVDGENKHRYMVASQDIELRRSLRKIPGVPLIYMNRSVMVLEPLSSASSNYSHQVETQKLTKGLNDVLYGKPCKEDSGVENGDEKKEDASKKRKGPKGPNPLSVKKKRHAGPEADESTANKKRRKRKHGSKKADAGAGIESVKSDKEE